MALKIALLVEDDIISSLWIKKLLELQGYKVLKANHGKQALDILSAAKDFPHVIITDYMMPLMTGVELIAKIENLYSVALNIPRILLTNMDQEHIESEMKDSAIIFVQKHTAKQTLLPTLLKAMKA